jgi:hypothetical protein
VHSLAMRACATAGYESFFVGRGFFSLLVRPVFLCITKCLHAWQNHMLTRLVRDRLRTLKSDKNLVKGTALDLAIVHST